MPATDRLSLMRDLQKAIRDDTLELHYQPKVRARSGETVAAEALLRWNHPQRGYVPPAMFVPIAERTGDIAALTEWVVGRAIADQARLLRMGHTLTFDLNISGGLLADPGYGWRLLHHFTALQGLIGFEITETAMIGDPERALSNLQIFAEAGIRLAIDDYGSGFSSLAYLRQLPITELKIDRMFVANLTTSQRDPLLIRSTIDLAHALGMEVTAEGVDSPTTLALLQVMGCDQVQGYLLSRPLPLDRLATYLTAQRTPEAIAHQRRISG
ncbi:EAL domain-containing protein [Sphingomonas nostoxanthinifaciens]|nr:EAL domain-containing protein [Sphingomonas nostoxanthinifaciens]